MADPINRTKQPYRIYKPLFLDENELKTDLDRELESVSQSLIWVTQNLNIVVAALNTLLVDAGKDPIELVYPISRGGNNG